MIILYSAFTLCLVAVLAITADALYTKQTRTRANAKMLSLIEKMKQRVPAPKVKAQVAYYDDCVGQICPGGWCCPEEIIWEYYDNWTCCGEDSYYICAHDADDCEAPRQKARGKARIKLLLMKMKKHEPEVKA